MSQPICKQCGGELELHMSVCTDNDCCGGSHWVSCEKCRDWPFETQSDADMENYWLGIGGDIKDFETS